MLLLAAAASCIPCQDEALNDLSSMPPVSVTMQPRNLPAAAAVLAGVLGLLVLDEAVLWLLPHAAITRVVAAASAAVAHALCLTLNLPMDFPQVIPGGAAREGVRPRRRGLVAESEPDHDRGAGAADIPPARSPAVLVLSYSTPRPARPVQSSCDHRLARAARGRGRRRRPGLRPLLRAAGGRRGPGRRRPGRRRLQRGECVLRPDAVRRVRPGRRLARLGGPRAAAGGGGRRRRRQAAAAVRPLPPAAAGGRRRRPARRHRGRAGAAEAAAPVGVHRRGPRGAPCLTPSR